MFYKKEEILSTLETANKVLQNLQLITDSLTKCFLKADANIASFVKDEEKRCLQPITLVKGPDGLYRTIPASKKNGRRTTLYNALNSNPEGVVRTRSGARKLLADCRRAVMNQARMNTSSAAFDKATKSIYKLHVIEQDSVHSLSEWTELNQEFQNEISRSELLTHRFKFLFTSKECKSETEEAFQSLLNRDLPSLLEETTEIVNVLKKRSVSLSSALADYRTNPDRYMKRFLELNAPTGSIAPRPFSSDHARSLVQKCDQILEANDFIQSTPKALEKAIKDCVESCLDEQVMEALAEIPIEELGRAKSGMSIKALKERGCLNFADAYETRSVFHLMKRVGYDTAQAASAYVGNVAESVRQDAKLRLSADKKTENTTRLVCAIKAYFESKILSGKRVLLDKWIYTYVSLDLNPILVATDDIDWLFAGDYQISKALEVKDAIDTFLNSKNVYTIEQLREKSSRLRSNFSSSRSSWSAFEKDPVSFINIIERICPNAIGSKDTSYGLPEVIAKALKREEPDFAGLRCSLRRYQDWGVRFILHQRKVLLGDEMGLGKTIQAIASMVALKNKGQTHFLVICPASVLVNWSREISKHSNLSSITIHGYSSQNLANVWVKRGGVGITTYETAKSIELPDSFTLGMLVVDEAHYVKNPQAQRTKNVLRLMGHTDRILYMTGTALENRVDEMVTLIGELDSKVANNAKPLALTGSYAKFRDAISPVYYRRKREDVLSELPELVEVEEWCELCPDERKQYANTVLSKNFMAARRVSWNVSNLSHSSKAKRLVEIIEEAKENGRKVLVFSFFRETLQRVCELLGANCVGQINGSVPAAARQKTIDAFNASDAGSVLALQIQSGGTGLNLQSANVVVICEPQFKPSIENQAISRAYRMGQLHAVFVHRLLAVDTVDERLCDLIKIKQREFDEFADRSAAAEADMENAAEIDKIGFQQIMEEELKRIQESTKSRVSSDAVD